MADTLKALPFLTVDDYMWKYSSAFIRLMAYDQSRIRYRKDGGRQEYKAIRAEDIFRGLGVDNGDDDKPSVSGSWMDRLR